MKALPRACLAIISPTGQGRLRRERKAEEERKRGKGGGKEEIGGNTRSLFEQNLVFDGLLPWPEKLRPSHIKEEEVGNTEEICIWKNILWRFWRDRSFYGILPWPLKNYPRSHRRWDRMGSFHSSETVTTTLAPTLPKLKFATSQW